MEIFGPIKQILGRTYLKFKDCQALIPFSLSHVRPRRRCCCCPPFKKSLFFGTLFLLFDKSSRKRVKESSIPPGNVRFGWLTATFSRFLLIIRLLRSHMQLPNNQRGIRLQVGRRDVLVPSKTRANVCCHEAVIQRALVLKATMGVMLRWETTVRPPTRSVLRCFITSPRSLSYTHNPSQSKSLAGTWSQLSLSLRCWWGKHFSICADQKWQWSTSDAAFHDYLQLVRNNMATYLVP